MSDNKNDESTSWELTGILNVWGLDWGCSKAFRLWGLLLTGLVSAEGTIGIVSVQHGTRDPSVLSLRTKTRNLEILFEATAFY